MNKLSQALLWPALAILGAFSFGAIALNRGEAVSAAWLVTAALCVYFIAYRFYSKFISEKVLKLDDSRMTPAVTHQDGIDYVPTNKYVLYGHHFAAIAGAGPLVGPVLAAQWGYLPGTIWLLVGVVVAGAVQDFVVLFCSMRRDGRSLGRNDQDGDGTDCGHHRADRCARHHDHHSRGARPDRGQGARRKSVGNLHRRRHHSARHGHGRLHAVPPPRQDPGGICFRRRRAAAYHLVRPVHFGERHFGAACSPTRRRNSPGP